MGFGELGLPHGEEVGKRDATVALAAELLGVNKGVQLQHLCCGIALSTRRLTQCNLYSLDWRSLDSLDNFRRFSYHPARGLKEFSMIVAFDRLVWYQEYASCSYTVLLFDIQ